MAGARAICRDCLAVVEPPRCQACRSPRLVGHPELETLAIAHIDCDAFYAAIEKRDDPSLADKPVIVGGARRGVVSTACYVARIYGVRSAMPMFKALKLCPDAVVIKPNMAKYVAVGREVRRMMLDLTPLVEPLSIDEAFLDLAGTEALHAMSPARSLAGFARRVTAELGITVSIGLAPNKFLAKIASDLDKPNGYSVVGRADALDFLAPKPVSIIWGVGRALQQRLAEDRIQTVGDLRALDPATLARRYGAHGLRLHKLCRGIDERRVDPAGEAKSVSSETTFDEDIADSRQLEVTLWRLAERVSARLKRAGIAGRTVTLKLKTADFQIRTRSRSLDSPTQLARRIHDTALPLLRREATGTRFRLIGVGVHDLGDAATADPQDLVDVEGERRAKAERAMDRIRGKFGDGALLRGLAFGEKGRARKDET